MKRFFLMILALTLFCSVTACSMKNDEAQNETTGTEHWADDWGISLSVLDVSPIGLTLVCTQNGGIAEGNLETGSNYWVEKNENGTWIEVKKQGEAVWDMMAHLIPSSTTTEWTIDWSWLYGALSSGTYRIGKTIVDFKESGASKSHTYFAEFEIKG